MFEYLRKHEMSRLVFDPFQIKIGESAFVAGVRDRKEFDGDIEKELLPGLTETLGKSAQTTRF